MPWCLMLVAQVKGVALQATNKDENSNQAKSRSSKASKSKKIVVESSTSGEDSSNDENQNIAIFIKSFKRIMKGGNKYKKNLDDKYKKRTRRGNATSVVKLATT